MSDIAFTHHLFHEPLWRSARQLCWQLSSRQKAWLLDKGSLTERLIAESRGSLEVTILRQEMDYPYLSEARLLKVSPKQKALVREVILSGAGQPWVFARSLLPVSSLTGRLRHFRNLDNRPLGALLFKDPSMERGAIEVAQVSRQHRYLPAEFVSDSPLWGRRSVFYLDSKPLLVSEVFLDSFNPRRQPRR